MNDEAICELIDHVERLGVVIQLEGEDIRVVNGISLSNQLLDRMKEHKQGIVSLLTRDKIARENGFLILLSGKAYEAQFSKTSSIFIQKIGDSWNAWRETWTGERPRSGSYSVIIEQVGFDYAMFKAKDRLSFVSQQRR